MEDADRLRDEVLGEISRAETPDALEAIRVAALGRRGRLTELMRGLGALAPEARREAGAALNAVKDVIAAALAEAGDRLGRAARAAQLAGERADVTLPVQTGETGRIHPISQTVDEIVAIFGEMGFVVAEGPHIEEDFYNFTALNIPPEHPARQEHDTFYLPPRTDGSRLVLRTHTSPVQIRTMQAQKPPLRIIVPGRTFRCDHDATHSPMFHEVDIGCSREGGELKIGAGGDWLEILGSGMVHPKVLENCGIDPAEYQGFAFGMGIERVAMLKYGIPDLRTFYDSDLRWLKHYGFLPLDIPSPVRGPLQGSMAGGAA